MPCVQLKALSGLPWTLKTSGGMQGILITGGEMGLLQVQAYFTGGGGLEETSAQAFPLKRYKTIGSQLPVFGDLS